MKNTMKSRARKMRHFEKFEQTSPAETAIIHQTFTPIKESTDAVEFDVRMPGRASHMSTTMYLERTFNVRLMQGTPVGDIFLRPHTILMDEANKTRRALPSNTSTRIAVMPGFVMQNNLDMANFNFNGGTVQVDSKWLNPYAKLYKKDLTPFIRTSGRQFSNHFDQVRRRDHLNFVPNTNSNIIYTNVERNQRHPTPNPRTGRIRLHSRQPLRRLGGEPRLRRVPAMGPGPGRAS